MSETIAEMEGYSKWLDEYLTLVPKHLMDGNGGSKMVYIRSLLDNTRLAEEEETLHRRVTDLCWKLNLAVQYSFTQDYVLALKCIDMANDELEFHVNSKDMKPSESHINAYQYVIKTSALAVTHQLIQKHGFSEINIGIEAGKLADQWNALTHNHESRAVVFFLKACLASSMRLPNEIVLDNLKQAITFEPDFHGWYRYLYRKLRQVRRSSPHLHNMTPADEEKDACKMAYSLRPDLGDNIANMANMLEEILHSTKKTLSDEEINLQLNALVDLLKNSIDLSDDHWAKVRLAEIYGYGYYKLNASYGEKLFQECIKLWPSKSMIWHKAGKFYHLGGSPRGCGPLRDLKKACEYYRRALLLSPCNFPCLMDYLKLLKNHDKITNAIDEYIPHIQKEYEFRKLLIIKGHLIWIHNITEAGRLRACAAWVKIIEAFPDSADEVASYMRQKRMEIVGLVNLDIDEIITVLQAFSAIADSVSTHKLITALKKAERADAMDNVIIYKTMENENVENTVNDVDANIIKWEPPVIAPVVPLMGTSSGYVPRGRGRGLTRVNK